MTTPTYVGIDVSKAKLDVAATNRWQHSFPNTVEGHQALIAKLQEIQPTLTAVESTGMYHQSIVEACQEAGVALAVVQPGCVRSFALSINQRAKTDAIDALVIARFAEAIKPDVAQPTDPSVVKLCALRDRRDQIVDDRVREQTRLESCRDASMRRHLQASIRRLQKIEATFDRDIKAYIADHPALDHPNRVLQRQTGVADQTAATLMAYLPELGHCNRTQIAALAGLAPYDRSSGQRNGKRSIYGGRSRVRRALYMAAISASRHDHVLKPVYQRLRAAGKPAKVAFVAIARKLLVRLNSLMAQHLAEMKTA